MKLQDIMQTKELVKYHSSVKDMLLSEKLLNAKYNNDFDLKIQKGGKTLAPQVLEASNWDVAPKIRDFYTETDYIDEKPLFRESMSLNEKMRKEFLEVLNRNNQFEIDQYTLKLFEQFAGKNGFMSSVRALNSKLLGQVLSTGAVRINDNGVKKVLDYRLDSTQKETLVGAATWNVNTGKPISDMNRWSSEFLNSELVVMTKNTYNTMMNTDEVKDILKVNNVIITNKTLIKQTIEEAIEMKIVIWDEKINENGINKITFPDGVVTLAPNTSFGYAEYSPTPAQTDVIQNVAEGRDIMNIPGTYATIEVTPVTKGASVVNIDTVISAVVMPNLTILDDMFIANVY